MKKLLASAIITFVAFAAHAQDLKTITLMDKVTVMLPGTPTEDNSKGVPMQKIVLGDSSEFYAGVIDFSVFGMDEATLQKMAGTDEFKQQMEGGIGAQPGVILVKNEQGKYADKYISYDMVLNVEKDGKKAVVSSRNVYYKQYSISISYKPGLKGENAELKNKIFNSIKIAE